MVMIAKTTPAMIIPILVPDVIFTPEVTKSGCMSMTSGRDKDKRDQNERKTHALWANQKNAPAEKPLQIRDRKEEMETAALTGIQQLKYLGLPIVLPSKTR